MSLDTLTGLAKQHGVTLAQLRAPAKRGHRTRADERLTAVRRVVAADAHALGVTDADVTEHTGIADPHAARQSAADGREWLTRDAQRTAEARNSGRTCATCACWQRIGTGLQGECRFNPPISKFKGDIGFWPQIAANENCDKHKPAG